MKRTNILALLLTVGLLCGCGVEQEPEPQPSQTVSPALQTTPIEPTILQAATEPEVYEGTAVETPCGTIYLPDDWDIAITPETTLGEPMVIAFWAEDVKLYELTFSEAAGDVLGLVQTADGAVYVGMRIEHLEEVSDMLLSMQESVNVLLSQLDLQPVSTTAVAAQPEADIIIDTAYGQLRFPSQWEDHLLVAQSEGDSLEFFSCLPDREAVLLFTVLFGTGEGHLSSIITAEDGTQTELRILIAEPEFDESWTSGEVDTVFAMQEDMNYLLDALTE